MTEKNNKVPIAILSCFLIAFILQGVLKISGILVFEKALDWEIFSIIDKYKWLNILYYSLLSSMAIYCLSFSISTRPYSKKWYHYVIIFGTAFMIVWLRSKYSFELSTNIVIDVFAYIVIPFIVTITTDASCRPFKNDVFGIVTTLSLNVLLYCCYLGLCYWSVLLNSLLPIKLMWLSSSANFLIQFEVYFGLFLFMLSSNMLITKIKGEN